jgi:hypothetical protein
MLQTEITLNIKFATLFFGWVPRYKQGRTNKVWGPGSAVPISLPSEVNRPVLTNILDISHLSNHFFPLFKYSQLHRLILFPSSGDKVRSRSPKGAWHTELGLQREAAGQWVWQRLGSANSIHLQYFGKASATEKKLCPPGSSVWIPLLVEDTDRQSLFEQSTLLAVT